MKRKYYQAPEIEVEYVSRADVLGLSETPFEDTFIEEGEIIG